MRDSFAKAIHDKAKQDDRIILLSGDIGNRMFDELKSDTRGQFLNCGIAEQTMMGVAAGLAMTGLKPVVYTIAPFTTYRCFEQIRVDVCYNNAPVIIVGSGAGLSYASLGPTHHSMEDIAILRTLPNMTVFCPSGPKETRDGLIAALDYDAPIYIRLGKKGEPDLYKGPETIEFGKAVTMRSGTDACIIGSGPVLNQAMQAAEILKSEDISLRVENFHTIKPLDEDRLVEISKSFDKLIVIEEHSRIGGLYGAIAEWCSSQQNHRSQLFSISGNDEFIHKISNHNFAMDQFDINAAKVCEVIKEMSRT